MKSESIFLPFGEGEQIHLKRFYQSDDAPALLLIHGSIEDGRIFYSNSGKGFAPWIAKQGFDVFVPDLRGRGKSTPKISKNSDFGQDEALREEYPALIQKIQSLKGKKRLFLGAHSWAGVNILAFLARPYCEVEVPAMVFFGSKRHISVRGWRYFYMITLAWEILSRRSIRRHGFLNAVKLKMGSDNLAKRDYEETNDWVKEGKEWRHWKDGFDYRAALAQIQLPPTLYIAGKKDHVLGHPIDVALLAEETGPQQIKELMVLSKANGFKHDYGHIDMLTHPDAAKDHFPKALAWLQKFA